MINRNNSQFSTSVLKEMSDAIDESMNCSKLDGENPFPINVFPPLFKNLACQLNKTLNYPVDYTGVAILAAIATVIGTTSRVKVKSGWYEYGSLYTCIVGNAGANKSHPISTIFSPIKKIDKINHDIYVSKLKEHHAYLKLTARNRTNTNEVPEPILKKMALTNFTPEVLNKILNDNHRGCAVLSDELASFFEGMNAYSKNDNSSNYLSFWSNKSITIDRMGKKLPLFIEKPYLSIIGGLQPRMLSKVFSIQTINNGFFQRFLFAYPTNVYKQSINDEEFDPKIMEQYSEFISNYIKTTENTKTKTLQWTKEAKDYFFKWQAKNCDLVNENVDNIKGEIITKYDNHFIRLSLILQIMSDSESGEITLEAVKGAHQLCDYFMNCSFYILSTIQNPHNYINNLPSNKKKFYDAIPNEFTTTEAVILGENYDFKERRVKEFLKEPKLFIKTKHGHYKKNLSNSIIN